MNQKQVVEVAKLMRTLKDKVICPICLDTIRDVCELSCGHKFCSDCFSQHKTSKKSVTCPLCKIPIMRRSRFYKDEYLNNLGIFVSNVCDYLKSHCNKDNEIEKILEGRSNVINEFDKLIQPSNASISSKVKRLNTKSISTKKPPGSVKNQEFQYNSFRINKTGKRTYSRKKKEPKRDYTILEFDDSKNRELVVKWLNDTRNNFDRLTQTQSVNINEDDLNINVTTLLSVSQQKLNKSANHINIVGEVHHKRRAKSVDFETRNVNSPRKKRFPELSLVLDNYNIEQINTEEEKVVEKAEEKVLLGLIEDEYLNKLESELQEPAKPIRKQKPSKKSVNESIAATPNSTTGWDRITEIKKSFKTPKAPKKLSVILNTSQCSTSQNQKENLSAAANIKNKHENESTKLEKKKNVSRIDKIIQIAVTSLHDKAKDADDKTKQNESTYTKESTLEKQNNLEELNIETQNKILKMHKKLTNAEDKKCDVREIKQNSNNFETVTAPHTKIYDLNELENYLTHNIEVCTKAYGDTSISDKEVSESNLSSSKKDFKAEVTPKQHDAQHATPQLNINKNNSSGLDYFEPTQKWNENIPKEDEVLPAVLEDEILSLEDINQHDLTSHSAEDLLNLLTDNLQKCYQLIKSEKNSLIDKVERGLVNMDLIVQKIKSFKRFEKKNYSVKENVACQTVIDVLNQEVQTLNIPIHTDNKAIQTVEQKSSKEKQIQTDFEEKSDTTYASCHTNLQDSSKNIDISKIITQKTKAALETFMDEPEMQLPRSSKKPEEAHSEKLKNQNEIFTCTLDNIDFDTQEIIKKNVEAKQRVQVSQKLVNSQPQSQLICTFETGKLRRNQNNSVKREAELSDSDEDIKPRAKRNRFLNSDLSIEFATNTERVNVQEKEAGEKKIVISPESDDFNYDECLNAILKKYDHPNSGESQRSNEKQEKSILEKCDDIIEQVTKNVEKLSKKHENSLQVISKSRNNKKRNETDIISESESLEPIPKIAKNMKPKEAIHTKPEQCKEKADIEFEEAMEFDDSLDDACFENIEVPVEVHPSPKKIKVLSNVVLATPKKCKDEDLFSEDDDIVESTPPRKTLHINSQSVHSMVKPLKEKERFLEEAALENCDEELNAIPPPPGFEDMILDDKPDEIERATQITIANHKLSSLTPDKLDYIQEKNKPSTSKLRQFEHSTPFTQVETATDRHALTCVSPIPKEKSSSLIDSAKLFLTKLTSTPKNFRSTSNLLTSTPKQKSMWNYVKSPQEVVVSPKPCIACTRISNSQMVFISQLTNKKLATYSTTFNKDVTHMIVAVKTDNSLKDYTLKFVCAVASGLWILRFDWILECLNQNRIVSEESYEILDDVGGNGPKMARLTRRENPLFKGFKFYCYDQFLSATKKDIEEVIIMLEGKVVSKPEDLTCKDGKIGLIITEGTGTQDFNTFEEWLKSYKIATVDLEWLSRSVGRYILLSIRPYLWCSDDDIDELGYPSYLTEKVPFSSAE